MGSRVLLAFCLITIFSAPATAQEIGPAHGALVIVGGGRLDDAILTRFLDLAGGRDAPIVVIPTANGDGDYGPPRVVRGGAWNNLPWSIGCASPRNRSFN